MALTIDDLKRFMTEGKILYYLHPDIPVLLLMLSGQSGRLEFWVQLDPDGVTLQFRSMNLLGCHSDHIHNGVVLAALGELNDTFRFVRLGWDRNSGAITAYHDVVLLNGTMTAEQFCGALQAFMSAVDQMCLKMRHVLDTGAMPNPDPPGDPTSK